MLKASKSHLNEVNESYLNHFKFALKFAVGCYMAAYYATVHALIPGLYKTAASAKIQELYGQLEGRNEND